MPIDNNHIERIGYRLENAKELERSMFPGSFATFYAQDVEALLEEISELKAKVEALEPQYARLISAE